MDQGYSNLLAHLHSTSSTSPPTLIQASLAHYLSNAASPTTLTASAITAPFFVSQTSQARLGLLAQAFRQAVALKKTRLDDTQCYGLFQRSKSTQFSNWVYAVLSGLRGGHPLLRLTCASGILLGLNDLQKDVGSVQEQVEEEAVISLAEMIDAYGTPNAWEKEFSLEMTVDENGIDPLALALIISAQPLTLVPLHKLKALPLREISHFLTNAISGTFQEGRFLSTMNSSIVKLDSGVYDIPTTSAFTQSINTLATSPVAVSVPSLTRLLSRVLELAVIDQRTNSSLVQNTFQALSAVITRIARDWESAPLNNINTDESIATDSKELMTSVWTHLKTLLFVTILLSSSVLSAVVYTSPDHLSPVHHSLISCTVLRSLFDLSFVIERMGGVATVPIPEMKRAFYTALDILGADAEYAKIMTLELCAGASGEARTSFALLCLEQLIPALDPSVIDQTVLPFCFPHINLVSDDHRDIFESAHSVILAILTHASSKATGLEDAETWVKLARKLIPYYMECLAENASPKRLSTMQLCLAYPALIRAAFSTAKTVVSGSTDDNTTALEVNASALAWLCIQTLVLSLHDRTQDTHGSDLEIERKHRIRLTLVSCLPAVRISILERFLTVLEKEVFQLGNSTDLANVTDKEAERRRELVQAIWKEVVSGSVGDAERSVVVDWWERTRHLLPLALVEGGGGAGGALGGDDEERSRL